MAHRNIIDPGLLTASPFALRGYSVAPEIVPKHISGYRANFPESNTLSKKWGEGGYPLATPQKSPWPFALARTQLYNQLTRLKAATTAHGTT